MSPVGEDISPPSIDQPFYHWVLLSINPKLDQKLSPPLSPALQVYRSTATFASSRLAFLVEETRASLRSEYEKVQRDKIKPLRLPLLKSRLPSVRGSLCSLTLRLPPKAANDLNFGEVILLTGSWFDSDDPYVVSLAIITFLDYEKNEMLVDVMENVWLQAPSPLPKDFVLLAHPLGSVLPLRRLTETLFELDSLPTASLSHKLIAAESMPTLPRQYLYPLSAHSFSNSPNRVNFRQKQVISTIFSSPSRLSLLQGPPGTGKTTTIWRCLSSYLKQSESVL